MRKHTSARWLAGAMLLASVSVLCAGCPSGIGGTEYDLGFAVGFAIDGWYWDGYFDGYDTIDASPYYYDDSGIPYIEELTYDAGYWDGVWYAYNDGYFVDYHYAFIIGFSEGYDNAFWPDYLTFLALDQHSELRNGGWGDGYEDGFSEGRVFGANDYEQGLPFDWLDALYDYESGTDLYFVEVDVGTGAYGPVELYEYGTHPADLKRMKRTVRTGKSAPVLRQTPGTKAVDADSRELYRPMTEEAKQDLGVSPSTSLRNAKQLRLSSTWFNRVNTYVSGAKGAAKRAPSARVRATELSSRVP